MKNILFYFMALAAPLAAENLFSNGTMDTAGGWKGDGKMIKDEVVKDPPNRFLQLSAKKSGPVSFHQEVDTKGIFSVALKFRYMTKDYKGPGLEMRGIRMDRSSTFTNRVLKADGEWHEMTWVFTQVGGGKKVDFSFILLQGEGDVLFDDVSAEASK
ncbi:hypothetical protein HQ447_05140 [bacterium]|nr:hypothetical protein [bacterium]